MLLISERDAEDRSRARHAGGGCRGHRSTDSCDLADAAERREGKFIRCAPSDGPRRRHRAEIDVACSNRTRFAVARAHDHAALLVNGVKNAFNKRAAGLDRHRLPKTGGALGTAPDSPKPRPSSQTSLNSANRPRSCKQFLPRFISMPAPSRGRRCRRALGAARHGPIPYHDREAAAYHGFGFKRMPASLLRRPTRHLAISGRNSAIRARHAQPRFDTSPQRLLQRKSGGEAEGSGQCRRDIDDLQDAAGEVTTWRHPGRSRRPRPAVCSVVTNHIGPPLAARAPASPPRWSSRSVESGEPVTGGGSARTEFEGHLK